MHPHPLTPLAQSSTYFRSCISADRLIFGEVVDMMTKGMINYYLKCEIQEQQMIIIMILAFLDFISADGQQKCFYADHYPPSLVIQF